jgi:hypothetical protein
VATRADESAHNPQREVFREKFMEPLKTTPRRKTFLAKPAREPIDFEKLERELAEEFRLTFAELAKK